MAKVTEKNTKKELLEYITGLEAKLADDRKAATTTADTVRVKQVEATKAAAKEVVDMNILSGEIVEKYNSLTETIDMMEREVEELHQIKVGLDTLEAILIAQRSKEESFVSECAAKKEAFEAEMAEKKSDLEKQIASLKEDFAITNVELTESYKAAKKKLELERSREQEEYTYALKRSRAKENDEWEDTKSSRLAELTAQETAIVAREQAVNQLEAKIQSLTVELAETRTKAEKDIASAYIDGEAKAEKTCAIKVNSIKKDAEWQAQIAEKELETLKAALNSKESECLNLSKKLDEAYTRIQQLAIEQSKANTPRLFETTSK